MKLKNFYNLVWGIQDDVDERDLLNQVLVKVPGLKDKASTSRRIYRQRVMATNSWKYINQEKFVAMPINLIPQPSTSMDQILNNRINDAWNEPTIIKVLIVKEELKPAKFEFVLDCFDQGPSITKMELQTRDKHVDHPYNWQFGIDKLQVQQFIHNWLNLQRYNQH